jgi:ribosomal protein S27E
LKNKRKFSEFVEYLKNKNNNLINKLKEFYKNNLRFFNQRKIKCPNCGKESLLSLWSFIQYAERIYPGPSPENACWVDTEVEMCYIICPNCRGEISIYKHPQKNDIISLIEFFGKEDLFAEIIKRKKPRL